MNTRRVLSLENLNPIARMIIEDNQKIDQWKLEKIGSMDVVRGFIHKDHLEYFWLCNELIDGGLVQSAEDGSKFVQIGPGRFLNPITGSTWGRGAGRGL